MLTLDQNILLGPKGNKLSVKDQKVFLSKCKGPNLDFSQNKTIFEDMSYSSSNVDYTIN